MDASKRSNCVVMPAHTTEHRDRWEPEQRKYSLNIHVISQPHLENDECAGGRVVRCGSPGLCRLVVKIVPKNGQGTNKLKKFQELKR